MIIRIRFHVAWRGVVCRSASLYGGTCWWGGGGALILCQIMISMLHVILHLLKSLLQSTFSSTLKLIHLDSLTACLVWGEAGRVVRVG